MKMKGRLIALVAALAIVIGVAILLNGSSETHSATAEKEVKVTDPQTGETKNLPAIDGGDPSNPMTGQQADADPRTPVVQGGDESNSWTELDGLLGKQASYTQCVDETIGTKWGPDIPKFMVTEAEGNETTVLLASNVNREKFRDAAAVRKQAKADGIPNAEKLEVIFADEGIVNTRGFEDGKPGCEEFYDGRSQIREGPAPVVYDANRKPIGVANDRGVFAGCHNPWYIPKKPPVSTTPGQTTTNPPPPPGEECKVVGCVTTTPPPPPNCPPGSTKPECLEKKNENEGAGARGNVPTSVQGTAPPATSEPRPPDLPPSYTPPPQQPAPPTTPRPEPPPPPPNPEPTTPFDPCNPVTPACG